MAQGSGGGSPDITQKGRLLSITTPSLGPDALILRRLTVTEAIRQPFLIEAEVFSAREGLKASDLLGAKVTCTVAAPEQPERHFNGIVRGFGRVGGSERDLVLYRLEIVPQLWNLSRTADCKIFQDKTVKDVVSQLLDEGGISSKQVGAATRGPRPYIVQFNETDLDFLHRLLDEVGSAYFFEHGKDDHKLVITDADPVFPLIDGAKLVLRAQQDRPDSVVNWRDLGVLQPTEHVAWDYDLLPGKNQPPPLGEVARQNEPSRLGGPGGDWQIYTWPSGMGTHGESQPAKRMMQRDEALADTAQGDSQTTALFAGGRIELSEGLGGTASRWLITAIRHEAVDETHIAGGGEATYANTFTAIPASRTWRCPTPQPAPVMPALQSALVIGPEGEEIHCDEYGRVKVRFLWDRADGKDFCWVRVAQPWAGAWGGTWFLPRINDEVLIGFLDGQPERPVVLGSLYNATAKVAHSLPGQNTRTSITTRSSKGGGPSNANILRFEDKKDSEHLYIQAERDMQVLVKKELTTTVGGDEIRKVQGSHKNQGTGNRTTTIKGKETLTVTDGHRETTIKTGNDTYTLETGNLEQSVKQGNVTTTLDMGNMLTELKLGNYDLKLNTGNITIKTAAGAVTVEAMQGITLKCGPSEVKIDMSGVSIKGMMVKLEGTMMLEAKGNMMAKLESGAMTMVKGGIIMIG